MKYPKIWFAILLLALLLEFMLIIKHNNGIEIQQKIDHSEITGDGHD